MYGNMCIISFFFSFDIDCEVQNTMEEVQAWDYVFLSLTNLPDRTDRCLIHFYKIKHKVLILFNVAISFVSNLHF